MRHIGSISSGKSPPGLVKARRTAELKEALRLWMAEFNRKAQSLKKRGRRRKADSSRG
jgi:hypothetical protein